MKFFNRARLIRPEDHYHLNPLKRFDFEDFLCLIEEKNYFVKSQNFQEKQSPFTECEKDHYSASRRRRWQFHFHPEGVSNLDGTAVCYSIGLRRSVRVKEAPDSVESGSEKVWMRCPCAEIRTAL